MFNTAGQDKEVITSCTGLRRENTMQTAHTNHCQTGLKQQSAAMAATTAG